jgi:hypothetical protein
MGQRGAKRVVLAGGCADMKKPSLDYLSGCFDADMDWITVVEKQKNAFAHYNFWCQVAITALLTREHWRWLNYGGLFGPGEGTI